MPPESRPRACLVAYERRSPRTARMSASHRAVPYTVQGQDPLLALECPMSGTLPGVKVAWTPWSDRPGPKAVGCRARPGRAGPAAGRPRQWVRHRPVDPGAGGGGHHPASLQKQQPRGRVPCSHRPYSAREPSTNPTNSIMVAGRAAAMVLKGRSGGRLEPPCQPGEHLVTRQATFALLTIWRSLAMGVGYARVQPRSDCYENRGSAVARPTWPWRRGQCMSCNVQSSRSALWVGYFMPSDRSLPRMGVFASSSVACALRL